MMITWQEFLSFADQKSWAWKILLGQEDERKLTGFLGTEVATTSGTSIDFTGIPSWVTQIVISFVGVSTNGTSSVAVQIGDSGGIATTGYTSTFGVADGIGVAATTSTDVFLAGIGGSAATAWHGTVTLTLEDSTDNTWLATVIMVSASGTPEFGAGSKALSATLDRVRITTASGTDTFDAGAVNIRMS